MSQPGTIYRCVFKNTQANYLDNSANQQSVYVDIEDMWNPIDDSASPSIVLVEPGESPLKIQVIDNEEDKFTPIRSKQATITLHSSASLDVSTFSVTSDRRYRVQVYINDSNYKIFIGWLSVSDLRMEFQPNPNEIVLTATDGLPSLKDIALLDLTLSTPRREQRLADYIVWCLYQTGHNLQLYVCNNIREEDHPDEHFYDISYLHAKTFEDEIGTCEDCYSVLEKILGEQCYLFQHKGRWYIVNVDEMESGTLTFAHFNASGEFIEFLDPISNVKEIGFQYSPLTGEGYELSWFGMPDTAPLVMFERPYKTVRESYKHELPKEIVDNIDFSRGDIYFPLTMPFGTKYYHIDDWTVYGGYFDAHAATTNIAYIVRKFVDNTESERYIDLKSTNTTRTFLQANPIPVHKYDKFSFGIDYRIGARGVILGATIVFYIFLDGDDGVTYVLNDNPRYIILGAGPSVLWEPYNHSTSLGISYTYDENNTDNDWHNYRMPTDCPKIPVDGDLYITIPFVNNQTISYQNLSFSYTPFINGSYTKYSGQEYSITSSLNTPAIREKTVSVSNSPKELFKGGLKKLVEGNFVLIGKIYNAAVFSSLPSTDFRHPFGALQAWAIWNQFNRVMRKFEGKVDGLQTGQLDEDGLPTVPDLIHEYILRDENPNTTNGADQVRHFQLIHFNQDLFNCDWDCFLYEVYNTTSPKEYPTMEFKYISA